ncbi:dolichol-phosphate mannosyltransferase [Rhizobium sp. BK376]|nr:dolichol-phosphate mannosyltransferase [Rhizobium sp. BK376]
MLSAARLVAAFLDLAVFALLCGQGVDPLKAQVLSFAVFLLFAAASFVRARRIGKVDEANGAPVAPIWFGLMIVQLVALAIRSGVFGVAFVTLGLSPLLAIGPAIAASIAASYAGQVHIGPQGILRTGWQPALVIGAIICLVILRLLFLGLVNLIPEETYYWNYAQHLDIGYLDHPPMVAWLIWLGTHTFGDNEFGVRIGAFLSWFATAAFSFMLALNLFGRRAALASCLLVSVMPFYFLSGFLMVPDAPLTAAWAGTLFFLERALIGGRRFGWLGAGVFIGLGMLSKYTIALLGPAALAFVLLDPKARRWLARPDPYAAAVLAAILFSPVVYWNAKHDWMSFAFQGSRRLSEATHFSLPSLLGYAAIVLTPTGLVAAIILLVCCTVAIFSSRSAPQRRKALFAVVFTLTPLYAFLAFSLFHENKPNWTGPLWLSILPFMAAALVERPQQEPWIATRTRAAAIPTIGITISVFALLLSYVALGVPGIGYRNNIRTLPVAWDEFGKAVASIEQAVATKTDKPVVLIGMDKYFLASEMAFYVRPRGSPAANSIGRSAIGSDSLMYDVWFPPDLSSGNIALLVSLSKAELSKDDLAARFSALSDIHEEVVRKRGAVIGSFYYRVGYDLSGCGSGSRGCPSTGDD